MTLTCFTLIEWFEYVRRNATLPGPSGAEREVGSRSFVLPVDTALLARACRGGCPRDEDEETVSKESAPWSACGIGGRGSPGESKPFFVEIVDDRCEPREKRPFAFGADATRRINRDAPALIALGDSGPVREDGVEGPC